MPSTRILFLSRAYPPVIGGIEKQNYELTQALRKLADVTVIANTRGKKFLLLFLPYAWVRLFFSFWRYDVVLLGDGVLSPLGASVKFFSKRVKVLSVVHGLDVTFAEKKGLLGRIYKTINIPSLCKLDRLIMVGRETLERAIKAGVSREKCVFIPNGIFPKEVAEPHTREELEKLLEMSLVGKKVILRVGRYVKHKGVEWFIGNVMPRLPESVIFVAAGATVAHATAGDDNFFSECEKAVSGLGVKQQVKLLTNVPWPDMKILLNTADLCVSPNIRVPGSLEGFGINTIEAAACSRVVLASDLDGLRDAVQDGKNGVLIQSENTSAWIAQVNEWLANDAGRQNFGAQAREYTIQHYSWEEIAERYVEEIEKVLSVR